jgi:Mrp family chromosome partitioning ATPase/capsular polysaccharide biosynthesis protein
MDNSQYINLEYASENPQLSAFVLNTLSEEFIDYYISVSTANKNSSLNFLDSLMQAKQAALAQQEDLLKKYKIDNGILNIDDEAKTIYGTIAEVEAKKNNAEKDIVAYNAALKNIDQRFTPENRKYFESSSSTLNSEIVNIKEQIRLSNDAYIQSGFDEQYKAKIDSLQAKLTSKIHAQTDNYTSNPTAAKDNLVAQKLTLEVSRDLAQNSVQTFGNELGRLNSHLRKLVPNLATIQALQAKIEVANKEYTDIVQKYNQAHVEANASLPVKIVEKALPGDPAPSKKIVLVALSSVVSLILCILALFAMFYFDTSISSKEQLENLVNIPVLGSMNKIKVESTNLQNLWHKGVTDKNNQEFKNSLRSIRYEIENCLREDNKVVAVTSVNEREGKTLFTESLAYAFSKANKKVLIIDGNFMNPEISNSINGSNFIETFLLGNNDTKMVDDELITVIGNKGGDGSLLELNSSKNIQDFFFVLKTIYDVIIIETSALDSSNKANAKEWISFADKVVVLFESGRKFDESASRHIHYLKQLGEKLAGMIINKTAPTAPLNRKLTIEKPRDAKAGSFG